MTTVILHAFPPSVAGELRALGARCHLIADDPEADTKWRDIVAGAACEPPPLDGEALEMLQRVRSRAAEIFDMYSRHFVFAEADVSEYFGLLDVHVRFALGLIRELRPDLVAFAAVPHEGYDYVLSLVAEAAGIPRVSCYQAPFGARFWVLREDEEFAALDTRPPVSAYEPPEKLPEPDLFYMTAPRDYSYSLRQMTGSALRRPWAAPAYLHRWYRATKYRLRVRGGVGRPAAEPYAYFPLHFQPELSTSPMGGVYTDQLLAVEHLRTMLAGDLWIVVKDHPAQTEMQRGRMFFQRLKALPRVVLVPSVASSPDLISGSTLVATVTGTAGWEALLAGKPVVVFGNAWYGGFDGVYPATGLDHVESLRPPHAAAVRRNLATRMSRAYEGLVDADFSHQAPGLDEGHNARAVARVLLEAAG
jgi:hypothetical protein